jgi:hypothetical protein
MDSSRISNKGTSKGGKDMRRQLISTLLLIVSTTASTAALAATTQNNSPIVGVWKAQVDSLPMMTLTVEEDKGKLTGAVLFYLIRRGNGMPETSTATAPEPLIDPNFDGKTLTFKVNHSHAHPGSENDSPLEFRLALSDDGKIRLTGPDGRPVEMVRETTN